MDFGLKQTGIYDRELGPSTLQLGRACKSWGEKRVLISAHLPPPLPHSPSSPTFQHMPVCSLFPLVPPSMLSFPRFLPLLCSIFGKWLVVCFVLCARDDSGHYFVFCIFFLKIVADDTTQIPIFYNKSLPLSPWGRGEGCWKEEKNQNKRKQTLKFLGWGSSSSCHRSWWRLRSGGCTCFEEKKTLLAIPVSAGNIEMRSSDVSSVEGNVQDSLLGTTLGLLGLLLGLDL